MTTFEGFPDALAPEFGTAKVFRPFRDVRFANERSPVDANRSVA